MADYTPNPISFSAPHSSSDDVDSDVSPTSVPTLSAAAPASVTNRKNIISSSSSKPPKKLINTTTDIAVSSSAPEILRKPRGRPPGSKNKPKPPIFITKNVNDSTMKPVIIEISAGCDIIETLIHFARKRHVGISIMSGSGSVSYVTLRHPMSHAPAAVSLHGPFNIVSVSGSFVFPSKHSDNSVMDSSFGICLAGAQGQVFGGIIGGKVVAASLVVVLAATFLNPTVHRLPSNQADEGDGEATPSAVGSEATPSAVGSEACGHMSGCQVVGAQEAMPWGSSSSRSPY